MDRYQFTWEMTPEGGARLLRMMGEHPCPVLPQQIEGFPLTELGDYCFAAEGRLPGQYRTTNILLKGETPSEYYGTANAASQGEAPYEYYGTANAALKGEAQTEEETEQELGKGQLREIGGNYLERLTLPESLQRVGKYAFYNCRQLTVLCMGKDLRGIGSDAFMNCHKLKEIHLRAKPEERTGVRILLAQMASDVEVFFETEAGCEAALLFPEYYESYDEIAPAHIFGRNIEGEGFRARQCFNDGVIDFKQYDTIFPKACAEENERTLCALAWNRLRYPKDLGEPQRMLYAKYIKEHEMVLQTRLVKEKNIEELHLLGDMGFMNRDGLENCVKMAAAEGWAKGAAELLRLKNLWFPVQTVKSRYTFEEF